MLNRIYILVLLFAFADGLCAEPALLNPPEIKSEIGYLSVDKNVPLPPVRDRVFILPQVDLLILNENEEAYDLVYPGKKYSTACVVPKYAKNTVIMIKDKIKNKLSFRGGLEVDTISLILNKGEELPIKSKVKNGYIAFVRCKEQDLPFFIPDDFDGVTFNKESAFLIFSRSMEAKGLRYFNGSWMPAAKVVELIKKNKEIDAEKAFLWKNLKDGAAEGVVVLKDNQVLHGKLKGNDSSHILFKAEGKNYWLGLDDIAHINLRRIRMRGDIDKAELLLKTACQLLKNDMGMAKKNINDALKLLAEVPSVYDFEAGKVAKVKSKSKQLIVAIEGDLKQQHKVIYHDTVFPEYVVDYHLGMGNILLKRKYWIKPQQKCEFCQATGEVTCPLCQGKGKTARKCEACLGTGRIKCVDCDGTGWRECNICGGKGYIYKKGTPRSYMYFGTTSYYPCNWRPGRVVTSGRSIAFVGPSPVFGRPFYSGSFISTGGVGTGEAVKTVCWKCGGTGTLQCPKFRKCKKCFGLGTVMEICVECKGKKKISCPKCHGKGFTGPVQKLPQPKNTNTLMP